MDTLKSIFRNIHQYEIKIRKAVQNNMHGDFNSIFKGNGIEFDDVRPYQYGDDTRTIDWNVSAKGHGTFVKTFKEDKDLNIFFVVDVSGSLSTRKDMKLNLAKELCGVLALVGARLNCKIGLLAFSDQNELITKTAKGKNHFYTIISRLIKLKAKSKQTSLEKMLKTVNIMNPKRSIIFIISDFIDSNYHKSLSLLSAKHDVIALNVNDELEVRMPPLGIIPVKDSESRKSIWVNTSFGSDRNKLLKTNRLDSEELDSFCKKNQIDYLKISTDEKYTNSLIHLFQKRNQYWKK